MSYPANTVKRFGEWALVTGASSGIGKEFARQLASTGYHLVLVARRKDVLDQIGIELSMQFGVTCKTIEADLSNESAVKLITASTNDLEIGVLISNAGTGKVGRFFSFNEEDHRYITQLNALSHLGLLYQLGQKMIARRRGAILLTGAMGAVEGVPYMAVEAGTKGFIQSLGKSLHTELKELGICVTVLVTPPTETPVYYKLGFTLTNTPIRPISVEQCVSESLKALYHNRVLVMPGLKFRVMNRLIPGAVSRKVTGNMMKKNNNII